MDFYVTVRFKAGPGIKRETTNSHFKVIFKKYFILCKGGIGSISAFYGLCTEFL